MERRAAPENATGYDDFGRRATASGGLSKAERAAKALERLKQKRVEVSPEARERSDRSRSGRRAREPRAPHAGFRPRGANHRF